MKIRPNNWREFQHYKDRNPSWVKLHKKLLDNFEFQGLPLASRALAPMLWLIASEDDKGLIDANSEKLAFRLRCSQEEIELALGPLIGKGFFIVEQFDSVPLAPSYPPSTTENINKENINKRREEKKAPARKRARTPLPEGFEISEKVKNWALGKKYERLPEHLEGFVLKAMANDYRYADWDRAFMNAVESDWAGLRRNGARPQNAEDAIAAAKRLIAEKEEAERVTH